MKNIIKSLQRLLKDGAILKCGDTEKVSPIYLENAIHAIWLAFVQSNYSEF